MNAPTAADFLAYAALMNGRCEKCGTIKTHDHKPRCSCHADDSAPPAPETYA